MGIEDIESTIVTTDEYTGTVDDVEITGSVYEQLDLVTYLDTAVSDVLSGDFTPTSLTTSARVFGIMLAFAGSLPMGGVFEIWSSDTNNRTLAVHRDDTSARTYLHGGLALVTTQYYWIRVRDMYGENSAWYPSSATAGVVGQTSTDSSDYLTLLIGDITEDQLVDALKTRINLIDRDYVYEEGVYEYLDAFSMVFGGIDKMVDGLLSENATNVSDINDLIATTLSHASDLDAIKSEITGLTTTEWANDQSYNVGRYVVYNDVVYRCTQSYTYPPAKEPGVDTDYWEEADSVVTLVSDVESRVDVLEGSITDKVSNTTFNALENRVTANEASIVVNANEIALRVEQTEFDAFSTLFLPDFSTGDMYEVNDWVKYEGDSYKCILEIDFTPAPLPTNVTYWEAADFSTEFSTAISQIEVNKDNITLSSSAIVGDVTFLFDTTEHRSYETDVFVETVADISGLDLVITQAGIDIDGAEADILLHTSQISGLDSRLSQAEIDIDGAEAAITLKASQSSLDITNANVTAAGIRIDGHDASISAQAIQISTLESTTGTHTTQIGQAQVDIDAAEAAILLRATKTEIDGILAPEWSAVVTYAVGEEVRYYTTRYDLYVCISVPPVGTVPTNDTYWTKLGRLAARVKQAEVDIDAAEAAIALKASQTDVSALTIRVSGAESNIAAGIAGTWASISSKATTVVVNAIDSRLGTAEGDISTLESTVSNHTTRISTAESNISAGEAGTWASISNKLGIATYDSDQKVGGVLRIGEAEEAITVLEGDTGDIKAQYTLKLNVNNRVAGFGLMLEDGTPSEFAIVADRFVIVSPSNDTNTGVPFVVGTIGGVSTVGIQGNLIVDGSILAQSMATGSITADKYYELRQTYVFTGDDSLDSSYPFEVPFKIASELNTIISVKVSFKIMPFRAYSKGSSTTSEPSGTDHTHTTALAGFDSSNFAGVYYCYTHQRLELYYSGAAPGGVSTGNASSVNHTHDIPDPITFGIYEESNSPTVHFHVDNGSGYGAASAGYTASQIDIDITSQISGSGWKGIRFDTNNRCRISAIIECKIDIDA